MKASGSRNTADPEFFSSSVSSKCKFSKETSHIDSGSFSASQARTDRKDDYEAAYRNRLPDDNSHRQKTTIGKSDILQVLLGKCL